MYRRQFLLAAVLSITCCVFAQQGQHTVVAMVLGKKSQKLPEIKVNGVKMNLQGPQGNQMTQGALVQGPPSDTATYIVGNKDAYKKPPVMAAALVMPFKSKPKTAHEKMMDELKLTKKEKDKLFPCDDYQPHCKNYAATGQCRDVWMQKNCRKSCKLCDVPYGVFIGCQDLDVCKTFATTACMVRWVRETCKSKCGQCGYERQANSHIVMGKKRHFFGVKAKQDLDKTITHAHEAKHTVKHQKTSHQDKSKQLHKVVKQITKKGKDEVKKAALKIQKIKEDVPKKTAKPKIKTNDKPEISILKPEVAVDERPVPKDEEDDSEESGEESKAVVEKNDGSDNDDDEDDADDNDDSTNNDEDQKESGSSQDEDEDDDESKDKASGHGELSTHDHNLGAPIRMDADPRGEPVVAKLVHQPIKFNDAPGKNVKIVKQKKTVKDAHPKIEKNNASKKVNSHKPAKKGKNDH